MALLPLGLLALHPAALQRLVKVGERVLGRAIEVRVPPYRDVVVLLVAHVPAWLLVGIATWFVARAFDASAPLAGVLFATSLSWVVGFVVIGVPGGIGVREAMFASVLGASVTAGVAASTALTARLLFVLVDVTGAVTVTALRRRRTRTAATTTTSAED
jgi:glycosyltransferase 2 family protein